MRRCRHLIPVFLLGLLTVAIALAGPEPVEPRLYYFSAENCSHCQEYGPRLYALAARHPGVTLIEHDIWLDRPALKLLLDLLATHGETLAGTPTVLLGDRLWVGLDDLSLVEIEAAIEECLEHGCPDAMARRVGPVVQQTPLPAPAADDQPLKLPLLGAIDPRSASLPLATVVLGLLDSVNPCAFFVLLLLLSLMVHAKSRSRMLTVGVVFVACSGLVYFLFMAAWLNLFLATGGMAAITLLAGAVATGIGLVNLKDYFFPHHGLSLSIPDRVKPGIYQRVRNLVQAPGYPSLLGGTVLLALAANSYELLCTAGLPMVFTRILTLHELPAWQYYAYLAAYNVVYVMPLLAIVTIFAVTLGSHRLSEREGQLLKLLSGVMMTEMGLVLLFFPSLLVSLTGTVALLLTALLLVSLTVLVSWFRQRWHQPRGGAG